TAVACVSCVISHARQPCLSISLTIEGTPRSVSPGLDLSAFRIVQEALTNALKHAGPSNVHVIVRYGSDRLVLIVDDDGVGPSAQRTDPTRPRYGHLGLAERAAPV